MPLKSYILEGTIKAGASWTQLDSLSTPRGKVRRFIEARVYFSASSNAKIRLNQETDVIHEISAEVASSIKYPYPMDLKFEEGQRLILEGMNAGASDVTVKVEVICEESKAR